LFFGSGRVNGANRDLFLTQLQADGTWGPATMIAELSSPATENRPTVRRDGLEIFFYSNRAGSTGNDLWTATRTAVDAAWSTPVNLGPTVNSSGSDLHPYLSADGRELYFASDRPGGLGGEDLYVITRDAKLTVTAVDRSRLFGQANPALATTITGFVGAETSAVVSGAAACTTTATPSSPAGTYPITCTAGSLGAPGYVFDSFVAGTLTVPYSSPCVSAPRAGPLHVAGGEAVCIGAGGSQAGPVTVEPGGSLDVEGGAITGRSSQAVQPWCGSAARPSLAHSRSAAAAVPWSSAATAATRTRSSARSA
jgi:hypothetical protein